MKGDRSATPATGRRHPAPSRASFWSDGVNVLVRRAQLLLLLSPFARFYPAARRTWQISRYAFGLPVTHAGDFAGLGRFAEREGLFLDVGASSGTSAMSFRVFNRRSPILSIEPNRLLERELRFLKRVMPRFDYLTAAAGDGRGAIPMYIPCFKGVPLTAYSSASREALVSAGSGLRDWLGERVTSSHLQVKEVISPMLPLDDLELTPAFIKIDVEGSELSVLRGLSATLERSEAVLLIERSGGFDEVQRFLAERSYRPYTYRPDVDQFVPFGQHSDGPNVFFLRGVPPRPGALGHSRRTRRRCCLPRAVRTAAVRGRRRRS
jgi:FkbM family methyltransferase